MIVLHRTRTSFLGARTPPFVNHCMRGLLHAIWRHPLPSVDTLRPLLRRRSQFGRLLVPECMSLFLVNTARTTHNYITGHTHLSIQIAKACAACIAPSACMASIYRGGTCSHSMIRMMRQACACVHIRRLTKRASTHLSEQVREQFAFAHVQQMVLALRDHAWMARSPRSSRRSPVSTTSEMTIADD